MIVFTVLCQERHVDSFILVFSTAELAIAAAKRLVGEMARHEEDIKERTIAGWLYYCVFSCEGCSVRVEQKEIDA